MIAGAYTGNSKGHSGPNETGDQQMRNRCLGATAGVVFYLMASTAFAGSDEELIALDKQWGEAGMHGDTATVAALLADNLVAVDGSGVSGKAEQLADNEPAPEGATYDAGDYRIMYLNDDTAVMTHSVAGDQAHYSLHVWTRKDGKWQVTATATVAEDSE